MRLKIAISSGKGGTGKTFVATNSAKVLSKDYKTRYIDCDVEEPNGFLFLKPEIISEEEIKILLPSYVDEKKCIGCKRCIEVCNYNALAFIKGKVMIFKELCHGCGACKLACPQDAFVEEEKRIGVIKKGRTSNLEVYFGILEITEGTKTPRLVRKVKEYIDEGINILDSPPGTTCPVVETVRDCDLCVLVSDPTPFGLNDLKLAVEMARSLSLEPVVLINRAGIDEGDIKKYCEEENLEIIGEIPNDLEIAKVYSQGELVIEKIRNYRKIFEELGEKIIKRAEKKRIPKKVEKRKIEKIMEKKFPSSKKLKEIVVISGKGGTGKTSLVACFSALADKDFVFSDCDVDASDLYLIFSPQLKEKGYFIGGYEFEIDSDKCKGCGKCEEVCRFEAVFKKENKYFIEPSLCEGCGACSLVCEFDAIKKQKKVCGEYFLASSRFGPFSFAKLFPGEENSGKLVSWVKEIQTYLGEKEKKEKALSDGSPGLGCPVISSLAGADYVVVVAEPTVSGIHDMERVLRLVYHFNLPGAVIINKYDLNKKLSDYIKEFCKANNIEVLGEIPYDENFIFAQKKFLSLVEYIDNKTTEIIKGIWKKIYSYFKDAHLSL